VLVFTTTGKNKDRTCDLTLKFPRMSLVPFRLHAVRGQIMGVPTPPEGTENSDEYNRDIYFFNTAAMESGYGSGQSRIVTLQASFHPRRLISFALQHSLGSSGSGSSGPSKAHLALQFAGQSAGLELYELNLKTPAAPSAGGGGGGSSDMWSWLEWIPKVGILGITLIGVVVWNIRKVTGGKKPSGGGGGGGFQEEMLKERLAKKREGMKGGVDDMEDKLDALSKKAGLREGGKSGASKASSGGASGSTIPGGLDLDADLDSLNASSREMEELLASMGDD